MNSFDDWKPIKLSKLGTIDSGRDIYAVERIDGRIPYITSGSQKNGIGYFVGNNNGTFDRDYISINRNGSVGLAFYHPYWSLIGNDCRKLHLFDIKNNINVGIFVSTSISMQSKSFSYSRKLGTERANHLHIMLPINENDNPKYQLMSEYVKEKREKALSRYKKYVEKQLSPIEYKRIAPLSEIEWKAFSILDLFESFIAGKGGGLNHLNKTNKGGINYIGATNRNNGVLCYVEDNETSKKKILPGNCIGFIKNGDGSAGYAIYKTESFISTNDVIYGYADWLNKYTGLFFVAAQDMIENKYSHGYKRNMEHLKGDKIMLPVNDRNEPDYAYMEQYAKNMMYRKYQQYLAYLDKKQHGQC